MCNYNCKYCNSSNNVIKKGIKYNKQCYYCKECKRYFTERKDKRIKRDIKKEYYHYSDNIINYLDCNNKHIIDKSETCLVESYNSSLRGTFARFRRGKQASGVEKVKFT